MSETLAVKHKNSLALKENKSLRETHHTRILTKKLIVCDQLLFFAITCFIFICYWFILCPLLFEYLRSTYASGHGKPWPSIWLFTYWLIAFLIWLLIMVLLILVCKTFKTKESNDSTEKSYGSSSSIRPTCTSNMTQAYLEDTKPQTTNSSAVQKGRNNISSSTSSGNVSKKHKDLPPLVIHRRMSGNDVENAGVVKMGNRASVDDATEAETEERRSNISADKTSIKDYLKLVTVTPSEDETDTVKSPKSPLSPRDLFFIDLIREAEKAESGKTSADPKSADTKPVEGVHFFPKNFSPTEHVEKCIADGNVAGRKPAADNSAENVEERGKREGDERKRESSYFIANVESPRSEKSEVFLEINPETERQKEWTVNVGNEKPVLILENASESAETKAAEGPTTQGIVLFEV